ncbi:MAG TPA: prolyl oligopeptidase family serine peptidase [Caulobacteraceae bacterium]|jgi:dipeptidyl aminopeptidase/acylaminoacyl peptidase|nr:prolyl oligopeptidase family serine peptidase [Caulobacteraceae bacterium]
MASKRYLGAAAAVICAAIGAAAWGQAAPSTAPPPGLQAFLAYPFTSDLAAAEKGGVIAWVQNVRGVRNLWVAQGPDFAPHVLTRLTADDGQELKNVALSPDGKTVVWTRGGDHDANWPAEGGLEPDPNSSPVQPKVEIWAALADGSRPPAKIAEGDEPTISSQGKLAFIKDHQVWTAPLDGHGQAERLAFDRGKAGELAWSPDGSALAFVSDRGDHAFVAVFRDKDQPLVYLAPSTGIDGEPRWSPDGQRIAFVRREGHGGPPEPILTEVPHPWSIWTADPHTGAGQAVWRSGKGIDDSFPHVEGEANLAWAAGDRLVFLSEADGWQHLYAIPATGGEARLLTPGAFMVEHVAYGPGRSLVLYDANTGGAPDDIERRHVFAVPVDGGAPSALTDGTGVEYEPVWAGERDVAFVAAGPKAPPAVAVVTHGRAGHRQTLGTGGGSEFAADQFVTPRAVTYKAPDGLTIHADLFETSGGGRKPAVIFVHGGPPRQMLLGWSYMDYYSNAYAVNEYLATHGFVVLSVNYRLGIGYGRAFNHPARAGYRGASEYQDVLAGARWLQGQSNVDPARIGIWGGSYGGFLTALALARNSDVFKAGVDLHGVHNWTSEHSGFFGRFGAEGYEKGDLDQAKTAAWQASPVASMDSWKSPVLLIQGDDDRNVDFHQTVDLARRLAAHDVPYEELVIPNEIHGFLRHASWLEADSATINFLDKELKPGG